jgi:hypothetical protein
MCNKAKLSNVDAKVGCGQLMAGSRSLRAFILWTARHLKTEI